MLGGARMMRRDVLVVVSAKQHATQLQGPAQAALRCDAYHTTVSAVSQMREWELVKMKFGLDDVESPVHLRLEFSLIKVGRNPSWCPFDQQPLLAQWHMQHRFLAEAN